MVFKSTYIILTFVLLAVQGQFITSTPLYKNPPCHNSIKYVEKIREKDKTIKANVDSEQKMKNADNNLRSSQFSSPVNKSEVRHCKYSSYLNYN